MAPEKNKALIAKRFSRCSTQYETVTPIQDKMATHLIEMVKEHVGVHHPKTVLELGCGTGRLSRKILEAFPETTLTAIDIAPDMIAYARKTISGATFEVADAETYYTSSDAEFDLIISNATVQWFETPAETLSAYYKLLTRDDGLLAVATFGNDTFHELRTSFSEAYATLGIPPEKHVHDLPCLDFWCKLFPQATIEEEYFNLEFSDVRSFLRSIQRAGATHSGTGNSTLTPSLYRTMSTLYKDAYRAPDKRAIRATYHALYILRSLHP